MVELEALKTHARPPVHRYNKIFAQSELEGHFHMANANDNSNDQPAL
jgi:hypothetical protein